MDTKKITVSLGRGYYKVTELEVNVPANLTGQELVEYLANNKQIETDLENALASSSLNGDENSDIRTYVDTNKSGDF